MSGGHLDSTNSNSVVLNGQEARRVVLHVLHNRLERSAGKPHPQQYQNVLPYMRVESSSMYRPLSTP